MTLPAGLFLAASRARAIGGVCAVAADAAARTGRFVLGPPSGREPAVSFFIFLAVGLGLTGTALLGLALAGLFFPSLIWAAFLLPPVAAFVAGGSEATPSTAHAVAGERGSPLARALRRGFPSLPSAAAGVAGAVILAAALLALVPGLVSPEDEQDAFLYGLGLPWQSLVIHRLPLADVPIAFHMPVPTEMLFALPLSLGDERGAKGLVLVFVLGALGATAALAARACPARPRMAGWLTAVIPLSLAYLPGLAVRSKSDAVAAALLVTAVCLRMAGRVSSAALLTGFAVSAKLVHAPFAAVLWFAMPPPPGRFARSIALAAVPVLPWLAKGWLATGDPAYPFLWKLARPFSWGEANNGAFLVHASALWSSYAPTPAALPRALASALSGGATMAAVLLPLALARRETRRPALAAVAGAVAALATGHLDRYLLPAEWLLSVLGARALAGLRGPVSVTAAALAVGAWCAARAWAGLPAGALGIAGLPWAAARARTMTTWGEATDTVRATGARRVLVVDDGTWPLPARAVFSGGFGETPLPWKWARESRDEAGLAVKFRQAGTPLVLHNYMTAEWAATRNSQFPWDARTLRLYRGFCARRLEPVWHSHIRDYVHGGYVLLRMVASRPGSPQVPYFMPGAESALAGAFYARAGGRTAEALGMVRAVRREAGDAGFLRSEEGQLLVSLGRNREALAVMGPAMEADLMDGTNLMSYARAAVEAGRWALADRALGMVQAGYPEAMVRSGAVRAQVVVNMADEAMARGNRALARSELARAEALVAGSVAGLGPAVPDEALARAFRRARDGIAACRRKAGGP